MEQEAVAYSYHSILLKYQVIQKEIMFTLNNLRKANTLKGLLSGGMPNLFLLKERALNNGVIHYEIYGMFTLYEVE